ncbi:MAG: glycoside hydrolase family 3 protein [Defluviitaleaceae bacterium]|nr:glycoside hydrolase family 3 protein [Defluviitaleaceae bacterium]
MKKLIFLLALVLLILAACSQEAVYEPVYTAGYYQHTAATPIPAENTPQPVVASTPEPTAPPRENPCFVCPSQGWIDSLTTREKIGQLIMPRLPWQTTQIGPALENWLAEYPVGGIILFADNVVSIAQVHALTAALHAASSNPLFIATDEEGGRVSRVGRLFDDGDFPILPAFEIGRTGEPQAAYTTGQIIGERLLSLGINMNFAPVADVWTNPANTVIGNRAFSDCPEVAGLMVEYAVRGLHSGGVLAVVKHFPGHGDTYEDSHYLLAVYPHNRERFDQIEAPAFIQGIEAGTDGVMIGHIATPMLQNQTAPLEWMEPWLESGTLPATFSDFWLQDVLRGEMGFDGLIITDALEMRALSDHFTPEQIALGTFIAGADILLMPTDVSRTFNALYDAFNDGVFDEERLHQSLRRIYLAHNNTNLN